MPTSDSGAVPSTYIGTNFPSGTNVFRASTGRRRKRTWDNTVDYSTKPRDQLPINTYTDEQYELRQPQMVLEEIRSLSTGALVSRTFDGREWAGLESLITDYAAIANANLRSESSQINETALKALVKTADAKSNMAVAFAEASKTADMVLGTATRVYGAYRSFRKGNFGKVADILNLPPGRVHKTWLEYKYGWMPLLQDVKGTAEFFAQRNFGRPQRFSVDAITVDQTEISQSGALEGWPSLTRSIFYSRKCRVKLECEYTNEGLHELQQLGVTNPALVAWELVPFSFVFDWFISVGDYLVGLTALHGITVRRSMRSFEKTLRFTRSGIVVPYTTSTTSSTGYKSRIEGDYRAYQRVPYSVNPLSLYPPATFERQSLSRLVSGLALLRAQSHR